MRYTTILFACVAFLMAACGSDATEKANSKGKQPLDQPIPLDDNDAANYTTVQWLDSARDIGSVRAGDKVDLVYRFRNTGDKPLFVHSANAGCGCTTPEFPKEAIMPGKEGTIKAVFNSINQGPEVSKSITVIMNTKPDPNHMLVFSGTVKQ
ncbi:MAG: hypothetical protein K0Q66_1689 [Chitinophagaceae bacterium]|jgi:hypothetical protein|nr:hypothetical protein [Chitinophagaceae bacterium]